eukprot:16089-Heterococcus_DN1.PRE.5
MLEYSGILDIVELSTTAFGRPTSTANAYTRTGVRCMLTVLNNVHYCMLSKYPSYCGAVSTCIQCATQVDHMRTITNKTKCLTHAVDMYFGRCTATVKASSRRGMRMALNNGNRAVVLTVASLEMFATYKAMHSQSHDIVTPCFTDVAYHRHAMHHSSCNHRGPLDVMLSNCTSQ